MSTNNDNVHEQMSTNNDNLGQRLQAHDPSCILTFMSITLLSNVIIAQVGRHISLSRRVTSRLRWLRFSRGWCCDSHRLFCSSILVDWNVNVCWKRIVCWCHWSRIQVTTLASHITVLRLHHVRSWRNRHVRLHCTTTIRVFHPDMFTWFQRSQVDHSVTFIKRFLLTLLIFTLCLPCILEM